MKNLTGQTKRLNRSKNENAITLVALIITIIILIILAAVTINSLTHEGLADMAIKGAQDYDKAQQDEMNMLNDIDAMVKETLKNKGRALNLNKFLLLLTLLTLLMEIQTMERDHTHIALSIHIFGIPMKKAIQQMDKELKTGSQIEALLIHSPLKPLSHQILPIALTLMFGTMVVRTGTLHLTGRTQVTIEWS